MNHDQSSRWASWQNQQPKQRNCSSLHLFMVLQNGLTFFRSSVPLLHLVVSTRTQSSACVCASILSCSSLVVYRVTYSPKMDDKLIKYCTSILLFTIFEFGILTRSSRNFLIDFFMVVSELASNSKNYGFVKKKRASKIL